MSLQAIRLSQLDRCWLPRDSCGDWLRGPLTASAARVCEFRRDCKRGDPKLVADKSSQPRKTRNSMGEVTRGSSAGSTTANHYERRSSD